MLVLSRKNDQAVVIGCVDPFGGILKVTVLQIMEGSVKLGFTANKDVPVHREEVWERMRAGSPQIPLAGDPVRTGSPSMGGKTRDVSELKG